MSNKDIIEKIKQNKYYKIKSEDLEKILNESPLKLIQILIDSEIARSSYCPDEGFYLIVENLKKKAYIPFLNYISNQFINENREIIKFLINKFILTKLTVNDFALLLENQEVRLLENLSKIYIEEKQNYQGHWYFPDNHVFEAYRRIFEKLEILDHSLLKRGIRNIIQEENLNAISVLLDLEVLETLDLKILEELIKNKDINLIDKILKYLKENNYFYIPAEKQIDLFDKINEVAQQNLKERIFETFLKMDTHNIAGFVHSNIFYYLDDNEFLNLINHPDFNFMKLILKTRKKFDEFKDDDSMYYFFESLIKRMRDPVIQKCIEIFKKGNNDEINTLIKSDVLWYLNIEEINPFINTPNSEVIKELLNLINYNYIREGLEYYIEKREKDNPTIIKKFIKNIFLNCNETSLEYILCSSIFYYITREDFLDIFYELPLQIQSKIREMEKQEL